MRKAVLIVLLLALMASTAAAAVEAKGGDGRLSVSEGRGFAWVQARGVLIGQLDKGSVTINDLTPLDTNEPLVWGAEREEYRGASTVYRGEDIRFRLLGGSWRVSIRGSGIDLSSAGRGLVQLEGDGLKPGVYSTSGVDCRTRVEKCLPLPDLLTSFKLGSDEGG
jgi:hypothetical protein